MKIGVLGSGMVGQAIGTKLVELGHDVVVGTRDPGKLRDWLAAVGGRAKAASFAKAAAHGEVIFNCTAGGGSLDALKIAGEANLQGKVLIGGGDHTIFVSGNDAAAKVQVTEMLKTWFDWTHVIDLGDITTARGTEMLLPVWVRPWGVLQTPMFNFKIVR